MATSGLLSDFVTLKERSIPLVNPGSLGFLLSVFLNTGPYGVSRGSSRQLASWVISFPRAFATDFMQQCCSRDGQF